MKNFFYVMFFFVNFCKVCINLGVSIWVEERGMLYVIGYSCVNYVFMNVDDICEWIFWFRRDIFFVSFESWFEIVFFCIVWLVWVLILNVLFRNFLNFFINKWIIVYKL